MDSRMVTILLQGWNAVSSGIGHAANKGLSLAPSGIVNGGRGEMLCPVVPVAVTIQETRMVKPPLGATPPSLIFALYRGPALPSVKGGRFMVVSYTIRTTSGASWAAAGRAAITRIAAMNRFAVMSFPFPCTRTRAHEFGERKVTGRTKGAAGCAGPPRRGLSAPEPLSRQEGHARGRVVNRLPDRTRGASRQAAALRQPVEGA